MDESFQTIKKFVEECSPEDLRAFEVLLRSRLRHPLEAEWGVDADTILSAIRRSSDLTRRGVRGIIAEAVFVDRVIPTVAQLGWWAGQIEGDRPFDALLRKDGLVARIQVKLQRLEEGTPKFYYPKHYDAGSLFVVEVQKTRTGKRITQKPVPGTDEVMSTVQALTVKTRPYSFGDFDILAVNMHPSSGDWDAFRYTVASWLLARKGDPNLVEIFQPVAAVPNDVWTDELATCLRWFESGEKRQVLTTRLH